MNWLNRSVVWISIVCSATVSAYATAASISFDSLRIEVSRGSVTSVFQDGFGGANPACCLFEINGSRTLDYGLQASDFSGFVETGGRVRFDPIVSGELAIDDPPGSPPFRFSKMNANTGLSGSLALNKSSGFRVQAIADLTPLDLNQSVGIRLSDRTSATPAGNPKDIADVVLRRQANGEYWILFRDGDGDGGLAVDLEQYPLITETAGMLHDQIAFSVWKDAGDDAIHGAFQYLSAGNFIGLPTEFAVTQRLYREAPDAPIDEVLYLSLRSAQLVDVPEPAVGFTMGVVALGALARRFALRGKCPKR